ncbi:hypothetical protein RSAG8_10708, partial [Rhizoctonia solani AG-8 WAC10335]
MRHSQVFKSAEIRRMTFSAFLWAYSRVSTQSRSGSSHDFYLTVDSICRYVMLFTDNQHFA